MLLIVSNDKTYQHLKKIKKKLKILKNKYPGVGNAIKIGISIQKNILVFLWQMHLMI